MTIKSDKWIRKMAVEHGMIEPFQEDQIRYSDDNSRLISYGHMILVLNCHQNTLFDPLEMVQSCHVQLPSFLSTYLI